MGLAVSYAQSNRCRPTKRLFQSYLAEMVIHGDFKNIMTQSD